MKVTSLCFTGTRNGLTQQQVDTLCECLRELQPKICRHGDCVGADKNFHDLVRLLLPSAGILIYPSNILGLRAYCGGDVILKTADPLDRNRSMVDASEYVVACPGERMEQQRSGTWSTIRYAKKSNKNMTVVYPDGSVEHFPDIPY